MLELKATSPVQMDQTEAAGHQEWALINKQQSTELSLTCVLTVSVVTTSFLELCLRKINLCDTSEVAPVLIKSALLQLAGQS